MKVRFRFTKEGETQYIGHLDIMRYFQKAIKRAKIDVAYSQGFNPHQILSFASPLGIGYTSTGEYFDADIKTLEGTQQLKSSLNAVMVPGIRVLDVKVLPDDGKYNAMASLSAASYAFVFSPSLYAALTEKQSLDELYDGFISQKEIVIHQVSKKSERDVNIRPLIIEGGADMQSLTLLLSAGSSENVKPLSVMDAFMKYAGTYENAETLFKRGEINIMRLDQFTNAADGRLISLSEVGKTL